MKSGAGTDTPAMHAQRGSDGPAVTRSAPPAPGHDEAHEPMEAEPASNIVPGEDQSHRRGRHATFTALAGRTPA